MIDLFRQYMLTQHDDAGRDLLRERLLADQELSDQLRDQEDNWIDAYATGQLQPGDAALLYQHLCGTGQLDRLATAAALARPRPAKPRRVLPYVLGIAAVLIVCFGALLLRQREPQQLATARPPAETIPLRPGTLRGGSEVPKVRISEKQDIVLQLIYQDTTPTGVCRVTIRSSTSEAKEDAQEPCGREFHAYTLTSKLAPGRYTVELAAADGELFHTYLFDVTN